MRSILALAVLLGGVTAVVCTNPVEVEVDRLFSVNIGVAAEDKPVTRVEITVPEGFDLDEPFGFLGWVGERRGDVVYFEGGRIEPYQCGFFTFKGRAPKKGTYVAEITAIAEDGSRRVYTNRNPYSAFPAMNLYAGVEQPTPEDFGEDGGGGGGLWRTLAVGAAIGALVAGAVFRLRRSTGATS
jgi:hypothetical protein